MSRRTASVPGRRIKSTRQHTESEVWDERYINNANFFRALVEDPNGQAIWEALLEERKFVAMTPPRPIEVLEDVDDCAGSRGFTVEQIKEKQGQII